MSASKLFTPKLHEKRGCAADSADELYAFMNPPAHAEVCAFSGSTDQKPYALRMSSDSQQSTKPIGRRSFKTRNNGGIY